MTDYPDEELMSFAANDDVSAFEELFHRHKRRVFDFFYRMVWNVEEARDCAQETFLRLWRGRARYTPKARFSTYLFQIAKNHLLDRRRKQKSRVVLQRVPGDSPEEPFEAPISATSAYRHAEANEIRSAISDAVARLPEVHRLVYVLSQEQRMSYKEIAAVLDCPVGTVSSRKVDAVRRLRKLLEPLRDELLGNGSQPHTDAALGENDQERDK